MSRLGDEAFGEQAVAVAVGDAQLRAPAIGPSSVAVNVTSAAIVAVSLT